MSPRHTSRVGLFSATSRLVLISTASLVRVFSIASRLVLISTASLGVLISIASRVRLLSTALLLACADPTSAPHPAPAEPDAEPDPAPKPDPTSVPDPVPSSTPAPGGGGVHEPPATLSLVAEQKFSRLFPAADIDHFEASGVVASRGRLFVAFDNLEMIASVDSSLASASFGPGAVANSQYEGITATDDDRFYVIAEGADEDPRARVIALDANTSAGAESATDTTFDDANAGFEGVAWVRAAGSEYLLALCENNACQDDDSVPGKGRVKLLSLIDDVWTTRAVLDVPADAAFSNYSDLALRDNADGTYAAAIVSHRSSAVWLGTLTTSPWALEGPGAIYTFPRNSSGKVQYCTVEGVTFLDANRLAFVSDKSDGDAPCNDEDESIHIFERPAPNR